MVGMLGVFVVVEKRHVLVVHAVTLEDSINALRPVFVLRRAVVAEEGVAVDEAHHTVSMTGHVTFLGGNDDDFRFEKVGKFCQQLLLVAVRVFCEDAVGNDGTVAT